VKVLVVGSGGREHALCWKLKQSRHLTHLFCAPGNAGIAAVATCVPIKAGDIPGLMDFVKDMRVDLTIVGPEDPLANGIVDAFQKELLPVFGPTRAAAQLEASKSFAKSIMRRKGVPTSEARRFVDADAAIKALGDSKPPWVVKADGLATGKGVTVTRTREEAEKAIRAALVDRAFGEAGSLVLLEEYMEGEELSVFALTDGSRVLTMEAAQDHKRVFDDDQGPNTGGMGAYSPVPAETPELIRTIEEKVLKPVIEGMAEQGTPYRGLLYAGIMLTKDGPKVVEFNCRFGDPETQVVIPRMKDDLLLLIMESIGTGLKRPALGFSPRAAVSVVAASGGYPGHYEAGKPITGLADAEADGALVFHAGTKAGDSGLVTAGGRVLNVTALGDTISQAVDNAYRAMGMIDFSGIHYRRDIARRALQRS